MTRIDTVVVNAVHRNWNFIKVLTDQPGLDGWGEAVGIVPWFDDICTAHPLPLRDHSWMVPEAPGLGITIDENAAAKHPCKQEMIPALDSILSDGRIANW